MHEEILNHDQKKLLPFVKNFQDNFLLVCGTAIALILAHRKSIDFDLATGKDIQPKVIDAIIHKNFLRIDSVLIQSTDEYTIVLNTVKCTFFSYPFPLQKKQFFNNVIYLPDLLTLTAMKAYALGRRGKWKDYVDLFFILRDKYSLPTIVRQAKKMFGGAFNEKLFREQLTFFDDVDMSEEVMFVGEKIPEKTIKSFLVETALQ